MLLIGCHYRKHQMNEWIDVNDKLPPQKWTVIVKNGKSVLGDVKYHYKKWHYWNRKLHKVTHWKFSENGKPKIPIKNMRSYLKKAKLYRNQMQPKKMNIPYLSQ